jgi:hypothetical protein
MKKLFLTLVGIVMFNFVFSQSFIGETKKNILKQLKPISISISKPEKIDSGYYSIVIKFQSSTNLYYFTKSDFCYFYIIMMEYNTDLFKLYIEDYDNKYLRAFINSTDADNFDKKNNIWKEPKGNTFVYRWLIKNINKGTIYLLFMTKDNYDKYKYNYYQQLLSNNN